MSPLSNFGPVCPQQPHMIHGADYNPEQWFHDPQVLEDDVRLMKLSGSNTMSVGIFSWAMYEPREGEYHFAWMDEVLERLHQHGVKVLLATPSGSKPAWLSLAYPEVRMVNADGIRDAHKGRHNHCRTSPVYRDKIGTLNRKLAERYGNHPAVVGWHVSNEYNGTPCHCELCFDAFRLWLKDHYMDLEALNLAWWSNFWSHRIHEWEEITHIDPSVHGMVLDWKRFTTDQTVDFYQHEIKPLRELTPDVPCMVNMMGTYPHLNYWKFAPHVDVISWDAYPSWHTHEHDTTTAVHPAFSHDMCRSFKQGKPFLLMESTPSQTNWQPVGRLKRPGMHMLSSLQAIAHGSDSVQYFQWRKSQGSSEKFHGAVVDHVGHENTRVFKEVSDVGVALARLGHVVGTTIKARAAVIFDWENMWAIDGAQGPNNVRKCYIERCMAHYEQLWSRGIATAVISQDEDLTGYDLVVAPMLYMVRDGVGERIEQFVQSGGSFVTTYYSGVVNQHDLCFRTGFPGPLRKVMGIWAEEFDVLTPEQTTSITASEGNGLGLEGSYAARDYADVIHVEGADVLATYDGEFYKGQPALTCHGFGKGNAYYVATRGDGQLLSDLYKGLTSRIGLGAPTGMTVPDGVRVTLREDQANQFLFVMNFNEEPVTVKVPAGTELLTDSEVKASLSLEAYGVGVIRLV